MRRIGRLGRIGRVAWSFLSLSETVSSLSFGIDDDNVFFRVGLRTTSDTEALDDHLHHYYY